MNSDLIKKIAEASKNEAFEAALKKAESLEDALKILAENGIETTKDELRELVASENEGELSEDNLEDVAGGVNWFRIVRGVINIIRGFCE